MEDGIVVCCPYLSWLWFLYEYQYLNAVPRLEKKSTIHRQILNDIMTSTQELECSNVKFVCHICRMDFFDNRGFSKQLEGNLDMTQHWLSAEKEHGLESGHVSMF